MHRIQNLSNGKNIKKLPLWLIVAADIFLVNAGFLLAFPLRFGRTIPKVNIQPFLQMFPLISLLALLIFLSIGLYTIKRYSFSHILRLISVGVLLTLICTMALAFWERGFSFPRSIFIGAAFSQFALLALWRYTVLRLEKRFHGVKKLLIIGFEEDIKRILPKVLALPSGWFDISCIQHPSDLDKIYQTLHHVDAVLLTEAVPLEDKRNILTRSFESGCEAFVIPDLYEILLKKSLYTQLEDTPVVEVPEIFISPSQLFLKRCMDLSVAIAGFILSLPLFILISFLIKITSPGPVFYKQQRVGYRGKIFNVHKFRSMVPDAEKLSGPVLATEDDPRITSIGKILRATRLDELPQLLNIITGDMSLVGPRPERPHFVTQFLDEIHEYRYRYLVKPGLTGLAQVRSSYSTSVSDKLRYDLSYIINYSIYLDLKIILETIPTILSRNASKGCSEGIEIQLESTVFNITNSYRKTT